MAICNHHKVVEAGPAITSIFEWLAMVDREDMDFYLGVKGS